MIGFKGINALLLPDYVTFSVNIGLPIPYTKNLLAYSYSMSLDRYGEWYAAPLGFGVGKTLNQTVTWSLVGGWVGLFKTPEQLNAFLTGHSVNFLSGTGVLTGGTWSPSTGGTAWNLGGGSPQVGFSYGYGFDMGPTVLGWSNPKEK